MRPLWMAVSIIAIDQGAKAIVRGRMRLGESIPVIGDWFKFTFTENPGMAFGIQFGSPLVVTGLAIVATVLIVVYLCVVHTNNIGYTLSLALILGGAVGNIIDRVFFAVIYGYGGLFQGQVVDFIHFDLWSGRISQSIPLVGGNFVALFPIWNVADMSIIVGVVLVVMFQRAMQSSSEQAGEQSQLVADTPSTEPLHS
ncbi:MAG: signal peptidase II [Rhodothermia bacterium]